MKRKSILLVLCIGMILTSCESKISLNSTDVKNEKNQKNTTMENPDKGYNLPIDEDKKKEVVNDCEEIMGIVRDIYSEYNGIQEADQNTAEQMMNRMKEIIKQNGNPVIGSDHYSVMDNYQKMEQFLKSAEQEEKGSVILYEADTDGGITRKEYSYDGKEMSVMSAKMIWSEDTEPVLTYISLSKIKEWAYTENGNFCYELCVPEPPEVTEIVDGSCIIRVKPLSEECREYLKKYVSTFGYQGNNLLCSNWNAEDMQGLDYNGLYEYFYQMKYGEKFTAEKEVVGIPAEEFENVIMTYLPVTKEELKKLGSDTVYMEVSGDAQESIKSDNTAFVYVGTEELKTLDYLIATKTKVTYTKGEKLNLDDLEVSAVYTDGSKAKVTGYTTNVKNIDMSKTGKKELWNSGDQWLYGVPESSSYVWAFRAFSMSSGNCRR